MSPMYTLHVTCPHCQMRHQVAEWPAWEHEPVLFTCLVTWGGCGGQALVKPPDATTIPHAFLEHVFVVAEPLTASQAARLLREHGQP